MAASTNRVLVTFDEYLEMQEQAKFRSEYHCGEVFAMAGGTAAHSLLEGRAYELLRALFPDCKTQFDLKVFAPAVQEAMYPDVYVICGKTEFYGGRKDTVLNPMFIVEVLSPSTRAYDLSSKASFYRTMPSVSTLLFIDSERQWIQRQTRIHTNWDLEEFTRPEQIVMGSGDKEFSLAQFYEQIEL